MAELSNNYTRITYQEILEDLQNRLDNDERFKNVSNASIFRLLVEMVASTADMTNYYMQRTAEEGFIDTCKLLSSAIKHGHNLGYNPIRNTPATAEIKFRIRGPLPTALKAGATVYFSQDETDVSFNGRKYKLWTDYSYTFTESDIINGKSATWVKDLIWSRGIDNKNYGVIDGVKVFNEADVLPIKIFQGDFKTEIISGYNQQRKLGKSYQFYDINDINFSNWYGKRDPNGYSKGILIPKNSYTQVGIGVKESEAFENLFEIEDQSIYLNEKVIRKKNEDENSSKETVEPLKICCITTNSDKTVRIQFGDGNIVSNGVNNGDESIFVKYLVCDGSLANTVGTKEAIMNLNNSFYATQQGSPVIDITPNVQIILNSDISNGVDFESVESIKINAPAWFASNFGKLITVNDFISYFRTLTVPIKVKNAIAWGQDDMENLKNNAVTYGNNTNLICYSIASETYNINGKLNGCYNVLLDNDDYRTAFTLYGNGREYISHLIDYVKILKSYDSIYDEQYEKRPTENWAKNVKLIRENMENKMAIGTKIFSLPPIVHYYDVVGTVTVSTLSKMQSIKTEIENKVYKWLNDTCNYGKKIYKSDIIKFFTNNADVSNVDLNIKISDIEKNTNEKTYTFDTSFFKIIPDTNISNELNTILLYKNSDFITENNITAETFKDKRITIKKKDNDEYVVFEKMGSTIASSVTEDSEKIVLSFKYGYFEGDKPESIQIVMVASDDFASTSVMPKESNAEDYGMSGDKMKDIIYGLSNWLHGCSTKDKAQRSIPLEYEIILNDIKSTLRAKNSNGEWIFLNTNDNNITHQETIKRVGSEFSSYNKELTERAFWNYFVPDVIVENYSDKEISEYTKEDWNNISSLTYDIYAQMKATFSDSILDDNNNIINFSMSNELPIVRLNINYTYKR